MDTNKFIHRDSSPNNPTSGNSSSKVAYWFTKIPLLLAFAVLALSPIISPLLAMLKLGFPGPGFTSGTVRSLEDVLRQVTNGIRWSAPNALPLYSNGRNRHRWFFSTISEFDFS